MRFLGPREITAPIPWHSGALWIAGSVMLVDEVFYSVSAVSGPVAVIGLAYGFVPVLAPLLSRLAGTDNTERMRPRHWACLMLAFIGNAMVFRELQAAQTRFTTAAAFAFLAGLLFTLLPVCSAKLQQAGLGTWAVLKAQGAVAATLSVPLLALLIAMGWGSLGQDHGVPVARSMEVGASTPSHLRWSRSTSGTAAWRAAAWRALPSACSPSRWSPHCSLSSCCGMRLPRSR